MCCAPRKGFIVVGDETDGTVTPIDVGLDGLVSKKKADFIGKRSLEQSFLKAPGRKQLVGLLTEDPNEVLPDGAYAVREVKDKPPMEMIGQVTSSYYSPTLNRSIAMALIENGRSAHGRDTVLPARGQGRHRARSSIPSSTTRKGAARMSDAAPQSRASAAREAPAGLAIGIARDRRAAA